MVEELAFFEELEKSDETRAELELKKLKLEHMRFEEESEERNCPRQERKEELEAAVELELKIMRLMMGMISGNSGRNREDERGAGTSNWRTLCVFMCHGSFETYF